MLDYQPTLLACGPEDAGDSVLEAAPGVLRPLAGAVRRTRLAAGAWVDVRPGWAGDPDPLFAALVHGIDWQAERRQMYDRVVAVPRLTRFYGLGEPLPHPTLTAAKAALTAYYEPELGEPFVTAGCALYRDGRDSVAWHGDTIGRATREDTIVAILSLGDTRRLQLRPRGGGPSLSFPMSHGDLVVMGGSCQRTWEHCVPKSSCPVGPRMSVQFRAYDVR